MVVAVMNVMPEWLLLTILKALLVKFLLLCCCSSPPSILLGSDIED